MISAAEENIPKNIALVANIQHRAGSAFKAPQRVPMATAEDNFRVEVWSEDEKTLLETVSRSPDFHVSLAAWHAAIPRRPGMLLVHCNANRIMEKTVAPGEPIAVPQTIVDGSVHAGLDATLRDLRHWHTLRAWCTACTHHSPMDPAMLKRRFGADVLFSTIESKLTCSKCRKGPVRLEVHSMSRD